MGARIEGEGWEAWRDDDGIVCSRATGAQHGIAAQERVAALEKLMAGGPTRGLLMDRRAFAGPDTPSAHEAERAFAARHPELRIAVVTELPEARRAAFELRAASKVTLEVFATLQQARAWLRRPPR